MGTIKKTIETWEAEEHKMLNVTKLDTKDEITLEEFEARTDKYGFKGVDYEARTAFLSENGYDATRENYLDETLTAKKGESEKSE